MWRFLTQSSWADRIGWVLVHSLWQFTLVALAAFLVHRILARRSAASRYGVLLAAMACMVASPIATWFSPWAAETPRGAVRPLLVEEGQRPLTIEIDPRQPVYVRQEPAPMMDTPPTPLAASATPPVAPRRAEPERPGLAAMLADLPGRVQPWLPQIVLAWLAGVVLAAVRPLWSWITVCRLRAVGVSAVPDAVSAVLGRAARAMKLRRAVKVLQSVLVKTPVVIGYLRPVVLLPLCVVTDLPEPQLELILAHELAHIRRHDYLVNLLQTLVETLFFYHPAVWWLSRQIRNERENCCDDLALAVAGSRADYGRALLAIEELRAAGSGLAVAASGGSLLARIRRVAGRESGPRAAGGVVALVLAAAATTALVVWGAVNTPATDPRTDAISFDDPLPEGSLMRLGTIRLRHRAYVNCVAFSPDGKTIASCADNQDADVYLWDAKTGKLRMRFGAPQGKGQWAQTLAFSPDGTKLAIGRPDGAVLLAETHTGRVLFKNQGKRSVAAVAFAPDGNSLASGGEDGLVHLWNAANGAEVKAFDAGEHPPAEWPPEVVEAIAFSRDGKTLAAGTFSAGIRVWNLSDGRLVTRIAEAHGSRLLSLAFSSGGKELISGGFRWTKNGQFVETKVWAPQTGKLVREIKAAELEAGCGKIALSADGKVLASGTEDAIHLWDPASGESIRVIRNPGCWDGHTLAVSADGSVVATSCGNSVALWEVGSGERRFADAKGHTAGCRFVTCSRDGAFVFTEGWDGRVIAWNAKTGGIVYELPLGMKGSSMAMSPQGTHVAAAAYIDSIDSGPRAVVRLWNARTGEIVREFGGPRGPYAYVNSLRFSQDNKLLAIASDNRGDFDDEIDVREIASGRVVTQIRPKESHDWVKDMAFSADAASLIAAWTDKVDTWDLKTGMEVRSFVPLLKLKGAGEKSIGKALFSSNAQRLFTSQGSEVVVWDVAAGRSISSVRLPGHQHGRYLGLSPDGRLLAAAEVNYANPAGWGTGGIEICGIAQRTGEIRILSHDAGQARRAAEAGDGRAISFAFSPDNKRLISGMDRGTALIWDVPTAAVASTTAESPAPAKATAAPSQPSDKAPAGQPGDRLDFRGQVVAPDGKPVKGAKVYLLYYTAAELPPPPVRAMSGPDGKFQFTMAKSEFVARGEAREPWFLSSVVAIADGLGIGWQAGRYLEANSQITDVANSALGASASPADNKQSAEDRTPVIRLVRDDVPIVGRIVDAKRRPVAGASVRILEIEGNRQNSLTEWLDAVEKRKEGYYAASKYLNNGITGWLRNQLPYLVPAATTDRNGQFRLMGVGRERIACLLLEGPGIATEQLYARTRPGPTLQVKNYADEAEPPAWTYYGAEFEHTAIASLPIVGAVGDKDTHLPLAEVTILNGRFREVYGPSGRDFIRAKTDAQGRYRLLGLPIGKGNELLAVPPLDGPYLLSLKQIDRNAKEVNFELKRGIPIRGRVTDAATGKPLSAQIDYFVFQDNPHARSAPGFDGFDYGCFGNFYQTDAQGNYCIPGLPGRGIVTASPHNWQSYLRGVGAERIKGGDSRFGTLMFKTQPAFCCPTDFAALTEVDPKESAKEVVVNFAMERQGDLSVTLLDAENKPLRGAIFNDGRELGGWWPRESEIFRITDYRPDRPQTLLFVHLQRKLAGSLLLRGPQRGPLTLRLQPWGVLKGRVVDAQGKPQASVFVMGEPFPFAKIDMFPPQKPIERASVGFHVKTDQEGRFAVIGLAPGVAYDIDVANVPMVGEEARQYQGTKPWLGRIATGVVVRSGETKDVGDVTPKLRDLKEASMKTIDSDATGRTVVTGHVVDAAGKGIAGALYDAQDPTPARRGR